MPTHACIHACTHTSKCYQMDCVKGNYFLVKLYSEKKSILNIFKEKWVLGLLKNDTVMFKIQTMKNIIEKVISKSYHW